MKKVIRGLVMAVIFASPLGFAGLQVPDAKAQKDKPAAAVFEIYKDRGGEFRFRLKDAEGNLLAIAGKGFEKKADCQAVIDAIKKDAAKAKVVEEK
jgi:uncharacterized protein YegP (UPF0339 family)